MVAAFLTLSGAVAARTPALSPPQIETAHVCPSDYVFIGAAYWYRISKNPECHYALRLTPEESRIQRAADPICEYAEFIAVIGKPISPQGWNPREGLLVRMNEITRVLHWKPDKQFIFVVRAEERASSRKVFRVTKLYPPNAEISYECQQ